MLGRDRTTTLSAADAAEVSIRGVVQMTSQSQEPDRRRATEASHTSSSSSSSSQKCHIILNLSVALLSVLMCVCLSLFILCPGGVTAGSTTETWRPYARPFTCLSASRHVCLLDTVSLLNNQSHSLSLALQLVSRSHAVSQSLAVSLRVCPPTRPSISVLLWLCHLFKTSSHSPPLIFRAQVKYNPHLAADAATAGDAGDGCRCCC